MKNNRKQQDSSKDLFYRFRQETEKKTPEKLQDGKRFEQEMQNDEIKISGEELEKQCEKFAVLFDLAPVGYFILDKPGTIEQVNAMGCSLLGLPGSALINKRFQSFIKPEETEAFFIFLKGLYDHSTTLTSQFTMINKAGHSFFVQIEGSASRSLSGDLQCYLAVIDITERRKSELKLQRTQERLQMSLHASSTGTWEIDVETGEITLDDFCLAIYGIKKDAFDGKRSTFLKVVFPEDRDMVDKSLQKALTSKTELNVEYRIYKQGRKLNYLSARGHVMSESDKKGCFVGTITDITDEKLLEQEALGFKAEQEKIIMGAVLQTQEKERERISEALHDSIGQLLYGIQIELQGRSIGQNSSVKKIKALLDQAIKEIRDFSFELAPSILKDFGLKTTLEETASRLSTERLTIRTVFNEFDERLNIDIEANIYRIVQELINNCIKHAAASLITIELSKIKNSLIINVTDNGMGFQSQNDSLNRKGSGISSIKNRVNVLNGVMTIKTGKGTGTSVNIILKNLFKTSM